MRIHANTDAFSALYLCSVTQNILYTEMFKLFTRKCFTNMLSAKQLTYRQNCSVLFASLKLYSEHRRSSRYRRGSRLFALINGSLLVFYVFVKPD